MCMSTRFHSLTHLYFFFFQAEDGIRDVAVTGVQTCALPIYLRDQSRGNVNQGHATQIRSCCKSGHVANDSAADRDDQRLAIRSRLAKGARNVLDCAKMLCGLRVIEKMQSFSMREPQAALNRLPGSAPDFGRGNDVQAGKMPEVRNFASRMADYTHSGNNGVGAGGRSHSNACDFHFARRFPM